MLNKYVTLRSNLFMPINSMTEGKEYKVLGYADACFIVLNDYGDELKVHHSHFHSKEEEKQSIFTHPKWVTAKETNMEINIIEGFDYKVVKVEEDKYWIENPHILIGGDSVVWYKKERFYEVTYEDVLPPRKKKMKDVEHFDGDFENLIYKEPVLDDCYLLLNSLSEEQLDFIANWSFRDKTIPFDAKLDMHFVFCKNDNDWYFSSIKGTTLVTFNDILIEDNQ